MLALAVFSQDHLSLEVYKLGIRHDYVNGKGSTLPYGRYLGKDGIIRFKNGLRVEGAADYKQNVDLVLDLNKRSLYVEKFTVGGGGPGWEAKIVQRHTGVHSVDVGFQEDFAVGQGFGMKGNVNATFQINTKNPYWKGN